MQADNARPNSIQVDQEESIIPQSLPTPYYPQNNAGYDFITAQAVEPGVSDSATLAPAADNARKCPHCPFVATGTSRLEYVTRVVALSSTQLTCLI